MCFSGYMQTTFFYAGKFMKILADDQCSSITKGGIYHIKTLCPYNILPWEWIDQKMDILMEVSIMFDVDTAFLLCTAEFVKILKKTLSQT